MFKNFLTPPIFLFCTLLICGCGGPSEGHYSGKVGFKNVDIHVDSEGVVTLDGYWQEPLTGSFERGSLKGKNLDALVFQGPVQKKFKLRILYEEDGDDWMIHSIQSRTFGPGARYLPTENESVFKPLPRLVKQVRN